MKTRMPLVQFAVAAVLATGGSIARADNFSVLYSFTGGADGAWPMGSLIKSGNSLYGMTQESNILNYPFSYGSLFSFDTSTNALSVLHTFSGGPTDGAWPLGSLTLSGNNLYGTTLSGGTAGYGTIFTLNTSTNDCHLLYSFTGSATDGAKPTGSLILSGNTLKCSPKTGRAVKVDSST